MKTKLKILVATDYSDTATNAVKYALQFAADTGSELLFLHVYKSSSNYPQEFTSLERFDDSPVEFENRELQQYIEEAAKSIGIKDNAVIYNCYVRRGRSAEEICNEAVYSNADLIFVGTHGASALHQVLLGSHTWDVIKLAPLPVLAIPQNALYTGVKNIVLATEYRAGELPVIKYLNQWVKPHKGKLTLFHVSSDIFSEGFELEMLTGFKKDIKSNIPDTDIDIKMVYNNDLVEGVNEFCKKNDSSWLAMSPEKSQLLEKIFNPIISATKKMSFYTNVPLLTVPDFTSAINANFWNKVKEEYAI